MTSTAVVPARAHLAGNPSDGYRGAVVSMSVDAFAATVTVTDAPAVTVCGPSTEWPTPQRLRDDTAAVGHSDGSGLVTATIAALVDDNDRRAIETPTDGFRVDWATTIPRSVGLGGSSAIVIATIRALRDRWGHDSGDPADVAELALAVEQERLGITAGIADRHVQAIGGVVHSDSRSTPPIARRVADRVAHPLLLAWNRNAAGSSDRYHRPLRARFENDVEVGAAMDRLATLADDAVAAIESGDWSALGACMDDSLGWRCALGRVDAVALEPVTALRGTGLKVNFAGSGGCVIASGRAGSLPAAIAALPTGWEHVVLGPQASS